MLVGEECSEVGLVYGVNVSGSCGNGDGMKPCDSRARCRSDQGEQMKAHEIVRGRGREDE